MIVYIIYMSEPFLIYRHRIRLIVNGINNQFALNIRESFHFNTRG